MAVCLLKLPGVCPAWCVRHRVRVLPSGTVGVYHSFEFWRPVGCWSVGVDQTDLFSPEGKPIHTEPGSPAWRPRLWLQGGHGEVLAAPVSAEELAGVLALAPVLAEGVASALREAARMLGWEVA